MNVLKIIGKNLENYNDDFDVNFIAADRVVQNDGMQNLYGSIYLQNLVTFVGVNASGKTRSLKIIEFLLKILFDKRGLNDGVVPFGITDKTEFFVYFSFENKIFEWHSIIRIDKENSVQRLSYYDETLKYKLISSVKNRKEIFDFTNVEKYSTRSELKPEILEMMKDDSSITIRIDKQNIGRVYSLIDVTNVNIMPPIGEIPKEVINLFDHSIEYLTCSTENNNFKCELKFKDNETIYKLKDFSEVSNLLSSGTIKGNYLFFNAVLTLYRGGYLIIDEIENHFHKELVKLVLDLFKSPKTNPNGATVIFSTHYAEILDFVDRKDNIYILNKINNNIKLSNYSDYVKRNDLKKSDVFLSGLIEGTIPKYENIKAFKEFLCEMMSEKR